jgi:hypothetical protein
MQAAHRGGKVDEFDRFDKLQADLANAFDALESATRRGTGRRGSSGARNVAAAAEAGSAAKARITWASSIATSTWRHRLASRDTSPGLTRCHDAGRSEDNAKLGPKMPGHQ